MEMLGYIALILLGLILGNLGMGGSMLAIPILVYLFSLNMVTASAYGLFITGTTSLAGFLLKQKDKLVDVNAALTFGIPSLFSSFAARKWIVEAIPDPLVFTASLQIEKNDFLLGFFSALMLLSSVIMITRKQRPKTEAGGSRILLLFPAGLFAGLLSGLAGAGGGFLILPSLVIFGRLGFGPAVGTTLIIISLNSLLGFCGDVMNFRVQWSFLLPVTGLSLAGLLAGYYSKGNICDVVSHRSFGWISAITATSILLKEFLF